MEKLRETADMEAPWGPGVTVASAELGSVSSSSLRRSSSNSTMTMALRRW
jgi:hypothetical protein